jgi:chaperonin GroEL
VVLEKIKNSRRINYGFDAMHELYTDMIRSGIVDPTKVNRSALEKGASVASMILTTESLVADKKEPVLPAAPAPDMGGMGGMY